MRKIAPILALMALSQPTLADDTPTKASGQWESVYDRSARTIKTGEWMGIGGVVAAGVGAGVMIGATTQLDDGSLQGIMSGTLNMFGGAVVLGMGYTAFTIGPTLTAGGAMRQSKAVRKLNPDAPYPWLGTSSWVLWGLGFPSTFVFPPVAILFHTGAYITAGLQKGNNRMHWNTRTAAAYEASKRSTFAVSLAPVNTDKFQGMMVFGRF